MSPQINSTYVIRVAFIQELKPDFVSRTIMRLEKTNFSHVGILFEDIDYKEKLFHSIGLGVCVDANLEYFKTHRVVKYYEVPMDVTREGFSMYVRGRTTSKVKYSQSQYLNQALRLAGLAWQPVRNDGSKTICSEEATLALQLSKLDVSRLQEDSVSPKMLDLFLVEQGLVAL